jgi:hypothetical protein
MVSNHFIWIRLRIPILLVVHLKMKFCLGMAAYCRSMILLFVLDEMQKVFGFTHFLEMHVSMKDFLCRLFCCAF